LARGYHFLGGVTQPFWGPYIWKTQEKNVYDVQIPSGVEQLPVEGKVVKNTNGKWVKARKQYKSAQDNPKTEVLLLWDACFHLLRIMGLNPCPFAISIRCSRE
jgi:hypothetical protein